MTILLQLITDRSAADVAMGTDKGFYGAADLNRVALACEEVKAMLRPYGICGRPPIKSDWQTGDLPNERDLARYLQAVTTLAAAFVRPPAFPTTMDRLDYRGANALEEALLAPEKLLPGMVSVMRESGTFEVQED